MSSMQHTVEVGSVCERLGVDEQVAGAHLHRWDHDHGAAPHGSGRAAATSAAVPSVLLAGGSGGGGGRRTVGHRRRRGNSQVGRRFAV